jgi:uncharacterized damage-inducible protein DinB
MIAQAYLAELRHEAALTRALLARVPLDKGARVPHPRSMPLARLAGHVAELAGWFEHAVRRDELNFAEVDYKPFIAETSAELLSFFDGNLDKAVASLEQCPDEAMMAPWTLRSGDTVHFTLPRAVVLRNMCMNHLVHHRAQLGVYLRLLDVPLPPMYGPTADEQAG